MKAPVTILKISIFICLAFLVVQSSSSAGIHGSRLTSAEEYVCLPCGQECDNTISHQPGSCSVCNMPLVKKSTVDIKNIQPSDICAYISTHPHIVLLDVRTKKEFEGKANPDFGTLKNAINIPVQELQSRLPSIDSLKGKEIIVYCSHSHRSPQAVYLLMQNGFLHVMNMSGGMSVMGNSPCKK